MRSMNRVFLMGHLGAKPEIRQSRAGKEYTRLSLATHRYRSPEEPNVTEWHSVFVFGDEASRCARWLDKGALIFVEGSLSHWSHQVPGEQEEKTYHNAVNARQVRFITYGRSTEDASELENLDIPQTPRNHNAVAHL